MITFLLWCFFRFPLESAFFFSSSFACFYLKLGYIFIHPPTTVNVSREIFKQSNLANEPGTTLVDSPSSPFNLVGLVSGPDLQLEPWISLLGHISGNSLNLLLHRLDHALQESVRIKVAWVVNCLCVALYVWNNFILSSHLNDSLTGSRIGRVEKKIRYESVRKEEIISPQNLEDFLLVCSIVERADTTLTQNPLTHVFSSLEAFRILSLSLLFWNFKMMCSIWGYFSFTVLGMWCTLLIWRPISKEICLYCTLKMSYHFLFPFYETPIVRLLDLLDYTSILAFLTDYPGKKE